MRHVAFVAGMVMAAAAAAAQETHQHADAGRFGTVAFTNTCSATVQPTLLRGVAQLHSFEFGPAIDAFTPARSVAVAPPSTRRTPSRRWKGCARRFRTRRSRSRPA